MSKPKTPLNPDGVALLRILQKEWPYGIPGRTWRPPTSGSPGFEAHIDEGTLRGLVRRGFVRRKESGIYIATELGRAIELPLRSPDQLTADHMCPQDDHERLHHASS
jgi:hypothetical protein